MNIQTIEQYLQEHNYPTFRLNQLVNTIKRRKYGWEKIDGWPDSLKNNIALEIPFVTWKENKIWTSEDKTKKALLTLSDSAQIETVLMQVKPGHWSVCLSCEVGCPMNCSFCATGSMGFKRALTSEEITDQLLFWNQYIEQTNSVIFIKSVVFMGMGEPFHNFESVCEAIQCIRDIYGIGYRHQSVSTSGLVDKLLPFAHRYPQVNLAISLHAGQEELRKKIMPVAKQYSLSSLTTAILQYMRNTKRQVMFEYLLINDVNDRPEDLKDLLEFLDSFPKKLVHVNIIRYNQTNDVYKPSPISRVKHWKQWLITHGISTSIRKNLGTDIHGACGQLAAQI